MYKSIYVVLFSFLFPLSLLASSYPEVIFDNSLASGQYAKSRVSYTGDSWAENLNGKLMVSDTLFFTPGNSLSLKYRSGFSGSWQASIFYNRLMNQYRFNGKDYLSLYIFVQTKNTKVDELPKIFVTQRHGLSDTIDFSDYVNKYSAGHWIQVKIPNSAFSKLIKDSFITGIGFVQNKASQEEHHIFVDQIEFLPAKIIESKANPPAILTDAIPYDKMVHLKWQLPLSPSIRYVKLYRSTDGKNFDAVGIRPINMQSCLDMVPKTGQKYFYKIVWLDNTYKESPASVVKEVVTKELSDQAVLDLVKAAHVNYFVENFDINSGMYMPYRSREKAIVSTKESAGAILSLIVGVENNQISRNAVLQRVFKISNFLLKADNKHGIFPPYFDGRKGVPEFRRGDGYYDVQATASLIEALLIARQYFNQDVEQEKDLRANITALYDQVNWTAVATPDFLLKAKLKDDNSTAVHTYDQPLFGVNESMNTYLLAISSRHHTLPCHSYREATYNRYNSQTGSKTDSTNRHYRNAYDVHRITIDSVGQDSLVKQSIFKTVNHFGVDLVLGDLEDNLIEYYRPFMTIKPQLLQDSVVDWTGVLANYTKYVKRRDNAVGHGAITSDVWGFVDSKYANSSIRLNPVIGPSSVIVDYKSGVNSVFALYKDYGRFLFTEYGFRSWLDLRNNDESEDYSGLNQAMLAVALENVKSGLIWKLYEEIPELKAGRNLLFSK